MENNLISAKDFCFYHKIEITFIQSLESYGLVRTKISQNNIFLYPEEISKLETYIRLSKDLEINLEGIHAVVHLLNQVETLQNELNQLKNELIFFRQLH